MRRSVSFYIFTILTITVAVYVSLIGYGSVMEKRTTGRWPWQWKNIGSPSVATREAPDVGTVAFLTNVTASFDAAATVSTTASWLHGDAGRLNVALKTAYATGTAILKGQFSDNGVDWFDEAVAPTSTADWATSTVALFKHRVSPGTVNQTTTYSLFLPLLRNSRYVRVQARKDVTDSAEDVKIWMQLIKGEEQ